MIRVSVDPEGRVVIENRNRVHGVIVADRENASIGASRWIEPGAALFVVGPVVVHDLVNGPAEKEPSR